MKTFLALLILASSAFAQPSAPLQFHGVSLGQPASAFIDCSTGKLLDKRSHAGRGNKEAKAACEGGQARILVDSKNVGGFGNVMFDEDQAYFNAGKVSSIALSMHKQTFENVVADMTAKLGRKPDNTDPRVFQNAFGANWSFGKAQWTGDIDVTVEAGVDSSSVPPVAKGVMVTIVDTKNLPVENRVSSLQ